MEEQDLRKEFDYQVLSGLKIIENETIRNCFTKMALRINEIVPDCAEKTLGIRRMQEALFWFLQAIARKSSDSKQLIDG